MIPKITFTSKATLKQEALLLARGDIEMATKIYDFLAKDMEDIPTVEQPSPSTFSQIKSTFGDIIGWIRDNSDGIAQGIEYIRTIRNSGGAPVAPPVNNIPNI